MERRPLKRLVPSAQTGLLANPVAIVPHKLYYFTVMGEVFSGKDSVCLFRKFVVKFFFKFFLYGYLLLLPILVSIALITILCLIGHELLSLIFVASLIVSLFFFVKYALTSREKWRYYRIGYYRLKTRGFNEEYFKYEMCEPCFRLIIHDLCHEFGFDDEYERMRKLYSSRSVVLELQKQRLVARVLASKAKGNQAKEVKYGLQG